MSEPEKSDNSDNAQKEAAVEPTPAEAEAEEPPKEKKLGRPPGAKDKQKRATPKRKPCRGAATKGRTTTSDESS